MYLFAILSVSCDIFAEFLEVSIHSILYNRHIYPQGVFERKKKYNVPVQVFFSNSSCDKKIMLTSSEVWSTLITHSLQQGTTNLKHFTLRKKRTQEMNANSWPLYMFNFIFSEHLYFSFAYNAYACKLELAFNRSLHQCNILFSWYCSFDLAVFNVSQIFLFEVLYSTVEQLMFRVWNILLCTVI